MHCLRVACVCCSSNGSKSGSGSQPLVQWTEVHNHPGLLCCITQTSNTPVVMMVKPDVILVQEIKVQPAKAKVCSTSYLTPICGFHYKFLDMHMWSGSSLVKKLRKHTYFD